MQRYLICSDPVGSARCTARRASRQRTRSRSGAGCTRRRSRSRRTGTRSARRTFPERRLRTERLPAGYGPE